jgi:hypothetical protein
MCKLTLFEMPINIPKEGYDLGLDLSEKISDKRLLKETA